MAGAGSATLAFAKESTFKGSLIDSNNDGTPEYYQPGRNPTVEEATLGRQLTRLREAGQVEAADSLAGNLDGAFTVSSVVSNTTYGDVRDIVFNDGGTGFTDGLVNSSRWFLGSNYVGGTTERVLTGCTPLSYSVTYSQGQPTRHSLTMGYADESSNTSTTPTSTVTPADGSDVAFHGVDLSIDSASATKLQEATLTIDNISRFQFGADPSPVDAIVAVPTTTLDATAIYGGPEYLELAYGSNGATTTEDRLSNVSGTLTLSASGNTVAAYLLSKLKPDSYSWNDLVNPESDTTEAVTFHVNGGVTVS